MKLTSFIGAILLFLSSVVAFNPFKGGSSVVATVEEQVSLPRFNLELDPSALLESRSRNSEIYTKAMIELKRLESDQTCHRLAAQLLMNNCRDVKETCSQDNKLSNTQNHHIESFANGLTLCDLSRGRFVVSDTCAPFSASSLLRVYHGGKGKLNVSPEQTTACIQALAKDHSQWLTWLKHRDNALMFCRAVRLDIDKDETITLHQELTRLMAQFAEGLDLDLRHAKHTMAQHTQEMDAHFENSMSQAGQMRAQMQGTMESFSNYFQDMSHSAKDTEGSMINVQRMMKDLLDTVLASNAEVAAGQEQALAATTDLTNSRIADINAVTEDTLATIHGLSMVLKEQLLPSMISISERQVAIDQNSEKLYNALNQMTEVVNNHTESLGQARLTTETIIQSLQKSTEIAQAWTQTVSAGGRFGDNALRFGVPIALVFLANYGITPSVPANVALILGGYGWGEVIVQTKRHEWHWPTFGTQNHAERPSSSTQLARNKSGTLTLTPVELDFEGPQIDLELV